MGDRIRAEGAYKSAIAIDSYNSEAHLHLGAFYADSGRKAEATREYKAVLESDSGNMAARAGLRRLGVSR